MKTAIEDIVRELRRSSPAKLAGAVKTYPMRELLQRSMLLQRAILHNKLPPHQVQELHVASGKLRKIITKRTQAAHQLIAKFADTTPEIIALHNSVFALVPSHDLLEDMKAAFEQLPEQLHDLTKASTNIFEAVNLEIQQKFYDLSPETIAIHYSGEELDAYRRLLKKILVQLDVASDIFKVYNTIIRRVMEGSKIHKSTISVAKTLCHAVFQTVPPSYDAVLNQCTTEEVASYESILRTTLTILERDITDKPSIVEFAEQCRQLLNVLPNRLVNRKTHMRKTTRVLQLAHQIEFLTAEQLSQHVIPTLMLYQAIFEETREFLLKQQTHLDIALNVKSLEDAQSKIADGLRKRTYAVNHLYRIISPLPLNDLARGTQKFLVNSARLFQEMRILVEELMRRSVSVPPTYIREFAGLLREHLEKLHEAASLAKSTAQRIAGVSPELEQMVMSLTAQEDGELVGLIRKVLEADEVSEVSRVSDHAHFIPIERLQEYVDVFIRSIKSQPPIN